MVTDADLDPSVAPHHRRVDVDEWDDIYVVGDVHGCRAELEALWAELDPDEDDLVVFVGDLVRKGPDSLGVMDFLAGRENVLAVRGNNEAKVLAEPDDYPEFAPFVDRFREWPLVISFDDAMVVHAGVDPRLPLAEHDAGDLVETRSIPPKNGYDGPFWFESYEGPPRVFFGHTVLDAPVVTEWAVGLDTGCVYGGSLTAYDYRRDELVSVPAEREYRSRADRKIVDLADTRVAVDGGELADEPAPVEDEPGDGGDDATGRGDGSGGTAPPDGAVDVTSESAAGTDRPCARYVSAAGRPPPVDPGATLDDPALYLNRELAELAFQKRVLHEALDDRTPLLERAKFLAIFTKNTDEFFMKRVGGLKQQLAAGVTELSPDGRTPREQLEAVFAEAEPMFDRQSRCWRETLRPALAEAGVAVVDHDDLSGDERAALREHFEASILPTLTPLTFDPAHPFPFISNLSLSLAVLTRGERDDEPRFSRVKIPENRPRFVRVDEVVGDDPDGSPVADTADGPTAGDGAAADRESARFVPVEQVVAANFDLLFPNVEVVDHSLFRVTRNAEVRRNEEVAEDLIGMIESVLRERRFATMVRLEVESDMPERAREVLVEQLDVEPREIIERDGLLDYHDLFELLDVDRPDLKTDAWTPQPHPRFVRGDDEDLDVFAEIRRDDVLVHHPYHSFEETVQRFFSAAAHDPDVLAIKAAIYRTAEDSRVIGSLIEAAKNGKQVAVMVELKARFDEENNLRWVKRLEEEGIHVAYGTLGLKTHTKTALVVREEDDGVRQYAHVGTGNYHAETAKTYEDLGLLTADPDIGHDLVKLFNYFTGHSMNEEYRKLLVAPGGMRRQFVDLVEREIAHARAGEGGHVVAKMNRLEDPEMVRKLYEASRAGVDVDLVVRDICRLRPGIEGFSENVTVRSVVGRFLEHSRVFYFGNAGDPEFYVGSADWMTRNLDRRVEAAAPIEDPDLRAYLREVLRVELDDNRRAWEMDGDGTYVQCRPDDDPILDTHQVLMERVRAAAERRRTADEPMRPPDLEDALPGVFDEGRETIE